MSKNIDTVKAIYAAFQTGNVAAILEHLADDVDWVDFDNNSGAREGIPWFVRRHGKAETVKFFAGLAEHLTFDFVNIGPYTEGSNTVAVQFSYSARYANGTRVEQQDIHWWTFKPDGKVATYRHFTDSSDHIEKWRSGKSKAA